MDRDGLLLQNALEPKLEDETLLHMYKSMTTLNVMDRILYESQRQVKIDLMT